MKLITRDTDYAIRALCYIAEKRDGVIPVSDLVKELKMPRPFSRKILQILNKKELLKSYRGKGGGFKLVLPPNKIFITDVIKVFQGSVTISECIFKKRPCPYIKICKLKEKIDQMQKRVIKDLDKITIASLL